METQTDGGYWKLLFRVRRSLRYHSRRQKHYTRLHETMLLFALLCGSASVTAFFAKVEEWNSLLTLTPPLLVSVFSGASLVFGTVQKMWLHADFVRRFTDIEKQLVVSDNLSAETLAALHVQVLDIESTEPPPLQVLNVMCRNEQMRAEGYDEDYQVSIGFWQRALSGFIDIQAHTLLEQKISSKT